MQPFLKTFFFLSAAHLSLFAGNQIVFVVSDDFNATTAQLQRYELLDDHYTPVGKKVKVNLGRSGLGWGLGSEVLRHKENEPVKQEGDGRAPAGIFALQQSFGYAPTIGSAMPYIQADEKLICVDDIDSDAYNTLISPDEHERPKSFEWMKRDDDLYEVGVTVAHNRAQEYRAGSCIFLHIQKADASPTAGCTSMTKEALLEIIAWLEPSKEPLLVQIPRGYCGEIEKRFSGVTCSQQTAEAVHH